MHICHPQIYHYPSIFLPEIALRRVAEPRQTLVSFTHTQRYTVKRPTCPFPIFPYLNHMNPSSTPFRVSLLIAAISLLLVSACKVKVHQPQRRVKKPVIYLYPLRETNVSVRLETEMTLTVTDPVYDESWNVTAQPDGQLKNIADGKKYPYLFWEATDDHAYSFENGFCVPGDSTEIFLRQQLTAMGLNGNEREDFIAYWLPDLQKNAYNIITFAGEEYTSRAKLHIMPEPNSMLRVFMVFRSSAERVSISPQQFAPFHRNGFTVVEWGGTDVSPLPGEIQ